MRVLHPHRRVGEYDGAYWCLTCGGKWGALPGLPTIPLECVPKPVRLDEGDDFARLAAADEAV